MSTPDNINERKYPSRLYTTTLSDDATDLSLRGTMETKIPEHEGSIAPPKNKTNQRQRHAS